MLSLCYMLYRKQLQSLWYNIKFYLLIQFTDQTEVYQNTNCIFLITSTHHGRRKMTYNIQEFCSSVHPLCHSVTPLKPVNMFQRIFWGLISYSPLLFIFYSNDFRGVPYQTIDLLFLLYERFESGIKYHKSNLYERLGINYLRHI